MGEPAPAAESAMSRRGHRFFVTEHLELGARVTLPRRVTHQLVRVLRLRPGDRVLLCDGRAIDFVAELIELDPERTVAVLVDAQPARPLPPPPIVLLQALLRHDHFDLVVEKATELGIVRIVPLYTQRTVVHLALRDVTQRLARWQRIAMEASEQCGRGTLPEIDTPSTLDRALATVRTARLLVFWEAPEAEAIAHASFSPDQTVTVAVGPEGGWTAEEIALFRRHGAEFRSLGPLILRAETAAISGIAAVQARTRPTRPQFREPGEPAAPLGSSAG